MMSRNLSYYSSLCNHYSLLSADFLFSYDKNSVDLVHFSVLNSALFFLRYAYLQDYFSVQKISPSAFQYELIFLGFHMSC